VHTLDELSAVAHADRCHPIQVNLDDDLSVQNALVNTKAQSIFLVTTTDFSYPTETTFNLKSRSFKDAEDQEYETICRVSDHIIITGLYFG